MILYLNFFLTFITHMVSSSSKKMVDLREVAIEMGIEITNNANLVEAIKAS